MTNGWKNRIMAHWDLIDAMAAKRFGEGALAEEAALYALECLQEENWQRLRAFSGRSSFSTFLRSVVYRLFEDFARSRFGRRRPPAWLRKLGGLWLHLFTLLCLERLTIAEAVERCLSRTPAPGRKRLERMAGEIHGRISGCGSHQMLEVDFDDEHAAQTPDPEEALDRRQRRQLLQAVLAAAGDNSAGEEYPFDFSFTLTGQERLLIRLRYMDGFAISDIADLLELSRHQVNGRLRRLHDKLRRSMDEGGLAEELRLQLAEK